MGSSTSLLQENDTTIRNEIVSINEQYVTLLYKITTNVTNNILIKTEQQVKMTVNCANIASQSDNYVSGAGSVIDSNQSCIIKAIYDASVQTITDATILSTALTEITAKVQSELKNSPNLTSDVSALMTLKEQKKTDGEVNKTIDAVKDVIKSIMGDSKEEKQITRMDIASSITTKNKSDLNVKTITDNTINATISNDTINSCTMVSSGLNQIDQNRNIVVAGGKLLNKQDILVNTFNKCFITNMLKAAMQQDVVNKVISNIELKATNDAELSNKAKTGITASISDITTSIASIIGDYIMYIVLGVGVLILLGGVGIISFIFLMKRSSKQTGGLSQFTSKYFLTYYNE